MAFVPRLCTAREYGKGLQRMASLGAVAVRPRRRPQGRFPQRSELLMEITLKILAVIAMIAVAAVLIRGLVNMMRGGSGVTSNKLMQMRVLLQAVAIALLLVVVYFARK